MCYCKLAASYGTGRTTIVELIVARLKNSRAEADPATFYARGAGEYAG